jgi:homocysteine S-methyltransferase
MKRPAESPAPRRAPGSSSKSAYSCVEKLLSRERCVVLDGGTATELPGLHPAAGTLRDDGTWGTWALYHSPAAVLDVHRRYVEIGCDVISTDTWGVLSAMDDEPSARPDMPSANWLELARRGIRVGREAIAQSGRSGECALAFSLHGDIYDANQLESLGLLKRVFAEDPPDLVLLETMSLIREQVTIPAVESLLETGIPVWLSFRRCLHGVCGVFGQHWGGPEGDFFGRVSRRFEEMGVAALLVNCIPPDHVPGILPWLRDFTDLPLGVYPNLGYFTESGWTFDARTGSHEYADLAAAWRSEGAQIIGGCCGVRPHHIAAARERLDGMPPGRPQVAPFERHRSSGEVPGAAEARTPATWIDERGRSLYPLPFPEIQVDMGVFVPTQGSFLLWKHLFRTGIGEGKRCLDAGCGTGLLAVQLALNGAERVHAIDIDRAAVVSTLTNAVRNGVGDRVTADQVDLFPWEPEERYDVVVASLYQTPTDPQTQSSTHRPLDYWGRNLVDHLIALLPSLLEEDGYALLMHLSVLSQRQTAEQLERYGLSSRVVDLSFFDFPAHFEENLAQIRRVEEHSDAYHISLDDRNVMIAYLLEVTPKPA